MKKEIDMTRWSGVALMIIACVVLFFFATSIPLHAAEKVVKLKYSDFYPPVHPIAKLAEAWCKEIEKRTNGRVTFNHYAGNTLTPPTQTYDSVVKGIADVGTSLMAYSAGRFPLTEVLSRPLGYTSGYQATKTANAYLKKFQPKEFADTKVMYLHGSGPGLFHTKKLISSTDDLKGLRIKSNAELMDLPPVVGAIPISLPITDTYDALQRGILDGVALPMEALKGWKIAELVKATLLNYAFAYTASQYVVMNKEKWDALPKDVQQIIEQVNEEWIEKQGKLWNDLDKEAQDYAVSKGVKMVQVSKEEQEKWALKTRPLLDSYVKEAKKKGLPGDEALNFCLEYIKTHP
jgi:TRAP-type transport system periplasmic protein